MKKLFTYQPTFAQGLALGLCCFFFVFGWHVISIASTGSDETLRWFEFWTVKHTFPAGEIWDTDMVYMIHYFSKRSRKHYFSRLVQKIHISWHMWLLLMLQQIRDEYSCNKYLLVYIIKRSRKEIISMPDRWR